jgi:hypothetical protein
MSQYGNYKNDLTKKMQEEIKVHRLCSKLIIKSWWASWLPFGWMHNLAAVYYARKAKRIYAKRIKIQITYMSGTISGPIGLNGSEAIKG